MPGLLLPMWPPLQSSQLKSMQRLLRPTLASLQSTTFSQLRSDHQLHGWAECEALRRTRYQSTYEGLLAGHKANSSRGGNKSKQVKDARAAALARGEIQAPTNYQIKKDRREARKAAAEAKGKNPRQIQVRVTDSMALMLGPSSRMTSYRATIQSFERWHL